MLAFVGRDFPRPHLLRDPERLLQALEALPRGRKRDAQTQCLTLVPASADAEIRPSTREHVERGDRLDQDAGVAVDDSGHKRAELRPLRHPCEKAQGAVAFEHRFPGPADASYLEEVVQDPEARETGFVRGPADLG